MAKSLAILFGAAFLCAAGLLAAGSAEACSYEGQTYPAGAVLCIQGKLNICQSNQGWKIDRSSSCSSN